MAYLLPHLHSGWAVDQAILAVCFIGGATRPSTRSPSILSNFSQQEEEKVVVIRFGHDWDPQCMEMDETLASIAEKVKNFAVVYLVDISEVWNTTTRRPVDNVCVHQKRQPPF